MLKMSPSGANSKDDLAVRLHAAYRGKVQTLPKCPLESMEDLAIWYTPGVAAASRAVAANRDLVYDLTNKGNTVAVLSDGSRVLGLGNIGPEAGLPVMEGKALLFKHFGGVDAVPICVAAHTETEIVDIAMALAPSFGGINLEDIATPKCFRILDRLRETLPIPVWHDDQQGTAMVVLAGLLNALEVVGKRLAEVRIALIGIGAANMAVYRLLRAEGVIPEQIIACDSTGTLHARRSDIKDNQTELREKWRVCLETNSDCLQGGIQEALQGADVCLAFSQPGPGTIPPNAISAMNSRAIVFACANPIPEIWPDEARKAGAAIVATGRGDFPNQVNNSLAFPGVFRGTFDVQARAISEGMTRAGALALARSARGLGLHERSILPRTDDPDVAAQVAAATGVQAVTEGLAMRPADHATLFKSALQRILAARNATATLVRAGLIPSMPDRQS
jgi:malate dehydrogenase (oxaloacetate-decarboxylating)